MRSGQTAAVPVLCYTDAVGGAVIVPPEALRSAPVLELHMKDGAPMRAGPSVAVLQGATDQMARTHFCE